MKQIHSKTDSHQNRRGIAILWLILWGSVFLTFFCVVLEIATLWQAHVEVNSSLDAAAMAAVKEWRATGFANSTLVPRNSGVAYGDANPVLGEAVGLTTNFVLATGANPNGNASITGDIVFGGLDQITAPITFDPTANIPVTPSLPAVRVQKTILVQGFCSALFGFSFLNVSASSVAYITAGGLPRLVSIP
jgi:hypothetical protein